MTTDEIIIEQYNDFFESLNTLFQKHNTPTTTYYQERSDSDDDTLELDLLLNTTTTTTTTKTPPRKRLKIPYETINPSYHKPQYLSSQIDEFGLPDHYGIFDYEIITTKESLSPLKPDYEYHSSSAVYEKPRCVAQSLRSSRSLHYR